MLIDVTALPPEAPEKMPPVLDDARFTVVAADALTALPDASCNCTVTGPNVADPDAPPDTGDVVNTNWVAAADVMLKLLLVAPVSVPLDAVSVYPVPALLIDRPENVATPLTAATVVLPDSVPLPGFAPIATVTLAVLVVRLPNWSRICTVGAGEIAAPAIALVGCCPNANLLAAAALIDSVCDALANPLPASPDTVITGLPALLSP
jgi:hypothetical protein